MKFTNNQNKIWKKLFNNQLKNIEKFACSEYKKGFSNLALTNKKIPTLTSLNKNITPATGWKVIRTNIRYSDSLPWYQHFAKHEFIVTNYLRSEKELEYTPEPDMFHDIFGHLPFLTLPKYTELLDIFTKAYFSTTDVNRDNIKRLAWFTYEFGLIKESGNIKAFGTGIISSKGEMEHVMSGKTPLLTFSAKKVLRRNKAIDYFNNELFVFDSLKDLKSELSSYFKTISTKNPTLKTKSEIEDREMDLSKYK